MISARHSKKVLMTVLMVFQHHTHFQKTSSGERDVLHFAQLSLFIIILHVSLHHFMKKSQRQIKKSYSKRIFFRDQFFLDRMITFQVVNAFAYQSKQNKAKSVKSVVNYIVKHYRFPIDNHVLKKYWYWHWYKLKTKGILTQNRVLYMPQEQSEVFCKKVFLKISQNLQ